MTPSPTDIQERETIARIIDEEAYTFRPWNENWRLAMANRQQDALAKADTILALRSNPQPGSEGKPVAWRWRYDYPGKVRWTVCQRPVHPRPAAMGSVAIFAEPLYAASPTPPTAQPGEVERLRSELLDLHAFRNSELVSLDRAETNLDAVLKALAPFMPISINETPDYAELAFGDHQTQAMTMDPAGWLALDTAYRAALTPSESQEA